MIIPFILATSMTVVPPTGPMITEIQIRGDSHIVLYHQDDNDIDISGFKLRKRSSTGKEYSVRVFPQGSIIPANGHFVWANSKNDHHLSVGADVWSTAGISRDNSVALISSSGDIVDSVAWGVGEDQFGLNALPNPAEGQIIKRLSSDGGYLRTGDVLTDFFLHPDIGSGFPEVIDMTKRSQERERKISPIATGAGIALLSSISILALKRSL